MSDLTLLLATANQINEETAKKIRNYVLEVTENKYPVISVSQKPIDFGKNICVGEIGVNKYNEYKQILVGLNEVKTKYVAVIDDDTLYTPEHFLNRPADDTFIYETNYWFAQEELDYFWRVDDVGKRGGMWGCIANTGTLKKNLTKRFEAYPVNPFISEKGEVLRHTGIMWGEPGVHDAQFGAKGEIMRIYSERPCVIFIHSKSMGYTQLSRFYRRYGWPTEENKTKTLEGFGGISDLWNKYYGN